MLSQATFFGIYPARQTASARVFSTFYYQDITIIVKRGLLKIPVLRQNAPPRESSNQSKATPCPRTFDRTQQCS